MAKRPPPPPKLAENTWETVRELVFSLPAVEDGSSYGTPALNVAGKLFVRKHQDGENIVVPMPKTDRAKWMKDQPDVFHITDHYRNYPYVLVRLATVSREELADTLYAAWRRVSPEKVVAEYDGGR